ncbi:MAG: Crp/Fnr family transcriptional regulator [Citrobacter freundii]|nr:MAG: Crp/Fnr family transcriptional regulator [Citrobacter freundii]
MSDLLFDHINQHISLDRKDFPSILSFFCVQQVKKKENLLAEGQYCKANYFVTKGCLRMFFTDDNGTEHTIQFALEHWWMTDIEAFNKGKKASFAIQAIESGEVLAIDKQSQEKLLALHPEMERYFRMVYERAYAASLFRVKYIFHLSKDKFYALFNQRYPEFVQRVPQKILASFLGFTPEYLSELRKKLASKKK